MGGYREAAIPVTRKPELFQVPRVSSYRVTRVTAKQKDQGAPGQEGSRAMAQRGGTGVARAATG
jgi:hypothetical protein